MYGVWRKDGIGTYFILYSYYGVMIIFIRSYDLPDDGLVNLCAQSGLYI